MSEEIVKVKLQKELLESERKEIKARRRCRLLTTVLCLLCLCTGLFAGLAVSKLSGGVFNAVVETNKYDKIAQYMNSIWVYGKNYENLKQTLSDKSYYGMTSFNEDPYTTYMSKEEMESFQTHINSNIVGIGCQYYMGDNGGKVTRVYKNSPSEEGGLEVNDIIYKIDGESVENWTSEMIKAAVTGQEGTKVKITVLRDGEEVDLEFTRRNVDTTCYAEVHDDVVVLTIYSFGMKTAKDIDSYLSQYKDYSKIIIDLRNNSGGYESSLLEIAGLFLGKDKLVLKEIDKNDNVTEYKTKVINYYDNFDSVVIITDNNTASAAEAFTACMKEIHPNCVQIGEKTYGKGVVQSSFSLGDGSYLKVTKSYWVSPNGVEIQGVGIEPDEEVKNDDIFYQYSEKFEENETYGLDSVSNFAKIAQMGLEYLGYDVTRTDGYFDQSFLNALLKYKKDNNLDDNEILDETTYNSIITSVMQEYRDNPDKDRQLARAIELLED